VGNGFIINADGAACGHQQACNQAQQGGFPTARRADDGNDFVVLNVQIDLFQCLSLTLGITTLDQVHVLNAYHNALLGAR
jgi:hypothetical protein